MTNNIFNVIRNQIVYNETQKLRGNEAKDSFKLKGYYPEKIITWITMKAKAFKIAKVTTDYNNGIREYTIQYKDLNTASEFIAPAYEKEEYKIAKYNKKHEFDHLSVVEKAFEMFIQKLGFDNYNDFAKYIETQTKDVSELIEEKYQEFLKTEVETQEYADGYSKLGYAY